MPWPPALTIITVHGKIVHGEAQTPAVGSITFTMPFPLRDGTDNVILAAQVFTATLNATGEFTIDLPATDDADIAPQGWTYRCSVAIDVWRKVFRIAIPAASPDPLEFSDIAQAENVPPVQMYSLLGHTHASGAVDSVFGRAGTVVAQTGDYTVAQVTGAASTAYVDTAIAGRQPLDSDLTAIAALAPVDDDVIQRKAGAWTSRTLVQYKTDLSLTKSDVGLANVDNTSDAAKPISTATQTALDGKAATVHTHGTTDLVSGTLGVPRGGTGLATVAVDSYLKGNGTDALVSRTPAQVLVDIGAAAAVHTHTIADVTSLQGSLDGKEPSIAAGTTSQYWRGDKSWQTLDKAAVGLANVDNTSDANKPVSTATQAALDLKAPLASPALTGTATAVNITQSGRYLNTPDVLVDAATIAVDASLGNDFEVTLGGNRTLGNPSNPVHGQKLMFAIRQDGTGNRTLTLDTKYRLGTDISSITLSTAAGKTDYLGVRYHGGDDKFDVLAFVTGY